jgi:hypothetical protein
VALTIGGRPAMMLDVRVAAGWTGGTCPANGGSSRNGAVALISADFSDLQPFSSWDGWLRPNERMRLVFVDLGSGQAVAISIYDTSSPSQFDALVAEAMPIVESFEFPD